MAGRNGKTPEELVDAFGAIREVERVETLHDQGQEKEDLRLRLYVSGEASQLVAPAAALLADRGLELSGIELGTPTLEDVFIHLTGRTLR